MEKTLQILSNATGTNQELLNIKVSPGVGDIVVQLDVYDQQNALNTTHRQDSTRSLNLNSHLDVFQAVLRQVENSSQKLQFLNILQHLLQIDPKESVNEVIWNTAEKLVHRAVQLENNEEAECLLRTAINHKLSCQNCCSVANNCSRQEDNKENTSPQPASLISGSSPPPGPSPPPPHIPGDLIPPPLLMPGAQAPPPISGIPLPPPLIPGVPNASGKSNKSLPQQNTPKATIKMKTLNWTKIPQDKIMGKQNLWTIMANNRQYNCLEIIDFKGIEGLFCLQAPKSDTDVVDGKKRRESKLINLLDPQRSLKINIFLSQFKGNNSIEEIIQIIRSGQHKVMGQEKLKDLLKYLPDKEEIEVLLAYDGDYQYLANAEKFLLLLLAVPNYKLRIESMLLKEEFAINITYLEPCIESIFKGADDLIKNEALQEVLCLIVIIGNFLNSGSYAGNAAGITLSSLEKLNEIRANKSGINLLHLIASEVEKYNPNLLNFTKELSFLENISRINIEQITKDIKDLDLPLQRLKSQIQLPNTDEDIKQQMGEFLKSAESQIGHLKNGLLELESLRLVLADFFCEDQPKFKLDECFQIFRTLCEQFKIAVEQNERRELLEKRATLRQKQKEEDELARKAKYASSSANSSPALSLKRRRITCNSNDDVNKCFISTETSSTDEEKLTIPKPHSLGDQDELLEYLRSSERELLDKSCRGRQRHRKKSLDKCPDLLKFNIRDDRERLTPNVSPHLNAENSVGNIPDEIKQDAISPISKQPMSLLQRRLSNGIERTLETLPEDKCLTISTLEPKPKRESLQIFIRSYDNNTENSKYPSSIVKVVRTPMPQTGTVFNFDTIKPFKDENNSFESISNVGEITKESSTPMKPLNIKRSQSVAGEVKTEEYCADIPDQFKRNSMNRNTLRLKIPTEDKTEILKDPLSDPEVELRRPNVSLKAWANVIKLGQRISSINEQELKRVKSNLRTPTIEGRAFSFSPVRELSARSSLATPTSIKAHNWNIRTPTIGGAEFAFSPIRELPPISSLALPNKPSNTLILNQKLNDSELKEEQKQANKDSMTSSPDEHNKILSKALTDQIFNDNYLQGDKKLLASLASPNPDQQEIPSDNSNADTINNLNMNQHLNKEPNINKLSQEIVSINDGNTISRGSNEEIVEEKSKLNNSSPKQMYNEIQTIDGVSILNHTKSMQNTTPSCQILKNIVTDNILENHFNDTLKSTPQKLNNHKNNFVNENQSSESAGKIVKEVSHLEPKSDVKSNSTCYKDTQNFTETTNSNSTLSNTPITNVKETPNEAITNLHSFNAKKIPELSQKHPYKETFSSRLANKLQIPIKNIRSLSPKKHSKAANETIALDCSKNNLSNEPNKKSKLLRFAQKLRLTKTSSAEKIPTLKTSSSFSADATEKVSNTTLSSTGNFIQPMRKVQVDQPKNSKLSPPSHRTSFTHEQSKLLQNSQSAKEITLFNASATQKLNITHNNNTIIKRENTNESRPTAISRYSIKSDLSDFNAKNISSNSLTYSERNYLSKNSSRRSSITIEQPKPIKKSQSAQKTGKTTNISYKTAAIANTQNIINPSIPVTPVALTKSKTKYNTKLRKGSTHSVMNMDQKNSYQLETGNIKESSSSAIKNNIKSKNAHRDSTPASLFSAKSAIPGRPAQHKTSIRNSVSSVSSITSENLETRRGITNTASRNTGSGITSAKPTQGKPSLRNSISSVSSITSSSSPQRRENTMKSSKNSSNLNSTPSTKGFASINRPTTGNSALPRSSISLHSKKSTTSANSIQRKPSISNSIASVSSITSENSIQRWGSINITSKNANSGSTCSSKTLRKPSIRNSISSVTSISTSNSLPSRNSINKSAKNANIKQSLSTNTTNNACRNIKISRILSPESQSRRTNVKIKATILNPNLENTKSTDN